MLKLRKITYLPFRSMIHSVKTQSEPTPIKLAFASYEDSQSRDIPPDSASSAPPLIIMHGLFGSKGNWNSLCKALQSKTRPQRKIIAVDARNHGDSPHDSVHTYEALAQDIKHLVDSEGLGQRVSLLGHSMGGRAVMVFALKWPHLVDRLLIADISPVSTSASFQPMLGFFGAMQAVRIEQHVPLSAARQQADAMLARVIPDKGVRAFLLTNLVQQSDGSFKWRVNLRALIDNYKYIGAFPDFGAKARFVGPTVFIAGGASDYIQTSDHPAIKKLFPKTEFKAIAGAGHWLHSEKPHEFLAIVLEALNRQANNN